MSTSLAALKNIAAQLRIDSVRSTSEAGTGHPTTCLSAADIVSTLFFDEMRFDAKNPRNPDNDRFILSKGHAAPILYSAWAEAGLFPREELLKLRQIGSDLEGHPTPRLSFVDVATGSLGQGICAAIGTALNARRIGSEYRTYVLCGDGEMAEGSVWEAADVAIHFKLDNLCGIIDVNGARPEPGHAVRPRHGRRLPRAGTRSAGAPLSSTATTSRHSRRPLRRRATTKGRPTMLLARTLKGKGLADIEGKPGLARQGTQEGGRNRPRGCGAAEANFGRRCRGPKIQGPRSKSRAETQPDYSKVPAPAYKKGDSIATREAWGVGLAAVGKVDTRVVALDADVKNSTFSDKFEKVAPDRFYENFIAEQVMVGAAMGLAARGAIPFPSTFACFLTRASDFVRMGGVSFSNVKFSGSHCGVSIGEDGPSQMALEDLAMMRSVPGCAVLYPCDGMSTERLVVEMTRRQGMAYMRTSRPKTPVHLWSRRNLSDRRFEGRCGRATTTQPSSSAPG